MQTELEHTKIKQNAGTDDTGLGVLMFFVDCSVWPMSRIFFIILGLL
jgi:hypothetical protein